MTQFITDQKAQPKKGDKKRKWRLEDFSFIGAGQSTGPGSGKLSINHDEEFAKAIMEMRGMK